MKQVLTCFAKNVKIYGKIFFLAQGQKNVKFLKGYMSRVKYYLPKALKKKQRIVISVKDKCGSEL